MFGGEGGGRGGRYSFVGDFKEFEFGLYFESPSEIWCGEPPVRTDAFVTASSVTLPVRV